VGKIYYGWWIVIACSLVYFYIAGMFVYSFTAFFEPISEEFGWSYTQISIAASIRGVELGIFAPIIGFLVDRFGSGKLVFSGLFTISLGAILVSLTNSLVTFYSAFFVLSLGLSACTETVIVPMVANWFRRDIGKALGIISSGYGAGGLLVLITISLINFYQWRTTFIILGLGIWLFGIPLILIICRNPKQLGYFSKRNLLDTQSTPVKNKNRGIKFNEAIKTKEFWNISIAEAIRLMTVTALITHVIPYLTSLGVSRVNAAFVATSLPVLSIIGRLVFGWLGDIYSKHYVMAFAYFLAGISLTAFAYIKVTWLIIPFLILFPLSWGASPLRGAIMREFFGVASLGSILGLMAGIAIIARILGPLLAGWTFDTFGSYQLIWLFLAGTFALAVILMLALNCSGRNLGCKN
jgi:sugar phosphate permease